MAITVGETRETIEQSSALLAKVGAVLKRRVYGGRPASSPSFTHAAFAEQGGAADVPSRHAAFLEPAVLDSEKTASKPLRFIGRSAPERLAAVVRWPVMPERSVVLNHLEQARRHVAEAERHLASQREIIAEKERDGHDTATSKQLLDQFEQLYRLHVSDRDRLERELNEISK